MKDFALIKGNIPSEHQKLTELKKKTAELIRKKDFRFVNCVTMRYKQLKQLDSNGDELNEIFSKEIGKKFGKELEADADFLKNKNIKRGVDDKGKGSNLNPIYVCSNISRISLTPNKGGYSVRLSVKRNPVKIKERVSQKETIILPCLTTVPEPEINFVSVLNLGDLIDVPSSSRVPIKTKNFKIDPVTSDLGTNDKYNSISYHYIRMNPSMLQKVRLGTVLIII